MFYYFFKFYFILFYNTVLVLPYINMNPPQVYTCSPSWTPLPPRTIPLGRPSAPAPSILYHASNLDWWFVSYMILYMFQILYYKHLSNKVHPREVWSDPFSWNDVGCESLLERVQPNGLKSLCSQVKVEYLPANPVYGSVLVHVIIWVKTYLPHLCPQVQRGQTDQGEDL